MSTWIVYLVWNLFWFGSNFLFSVSCVLFGPVEMFRISNTHAAQRTIPFDELRNLISSFDIRKKKQRPLHYQLSTFAIAKKFIHIWERDCFSLSKEDSFAASEKLSQIIRSFSDHSKWQWIWPGKKSTDFRWCKTTNLFTKLMRLCCWLHKPSKEIKKNENSCGQTQSEFFLCFNSIDHCAAVPLPIN